MTSSIQERKTKREKKCNRCGGLISIANPTGWCNHIYYPENTSSEPTPSTEGWDDLMRLYKEFPFLETFEGRVLTAKLTDFISTAIESARKEARRGVIQTIRKWTNGRTVTKDSLRKYLNTLRKQP
jgi:hypothetical protein